MRGEIQLALQQNLDNSNCKGQKLEPSRVIVGQNYSNKRFR